MLVGVRPHLIRDEAHPVRRSRTPHEPRSVSWRVSFTATPTSPPDVPAEEHMAIVRGELSGASNVLCRVHSECWTSEVLGSLKCDCRDQLDAALDRIASEGAGVIVYLRQEGRVASASVARSAPTRCRTTAPTPSRPTWRSASAGRRSDVRSRGRDPRPTSACARCGCSRITRSRWRGSRRPASSSPIGSSHWVGENQYNAEYLAVKRRKMGHHPDNPVKLRAISSKPARSSGAGTNFAISDTCHRPARSCHSYRRRNPRRTPGSSSRIPLCKVGFVTAEHGRRRRRRRRRARGRSTPSSSRRRPARRRMSSRRSIQAAVGKLPGVTAVRGSAWAPCVVGQPNHPSNPRLPGVKNIIAVAAAASGVRQDRPSAPTWRPRCRAWAPRSASSDADVYGPSIPQMMGFRPRSRPARRRAARSFPRSTTACG